MLNVADRFTRWLERSRRAGLTQAEIARQLGRNRSFISQLKSGIRRPTLDVAAQIEEMSGIPASAWATTRVTSGSTEKPTTGNRRIA